MPVDGFHGIGGRQRSANRVGIFQKAEVVVALFAQLGNETGVGIVETVTELLKLSGADRFVPCTFDSAPSLLEFAESVLER